MYEEIGGDDIAKALFIEVEGSNSEISSRCEFVRYDLERYNNRNT